MLNHLNHLSNFLDLNYILNPVVPNDFSSNVENVRSQHAIHFHPLLNWYNLDQNTCLHFYLWQWVQKEVSIVYFLTIQSQHFWTKGGFSISANRFCHSPTSLSGQWQRILWLQTHIHCSINLVNQPWGWGLTSTVYYGIHSWTGVSRRPFRI